MARSLSELRKFNRERRARQRAAARAAGVPSGARVNAAIAEAVSFSMRAGVNIGEDGHPRLYVDTAVVLKAAVDILVLRGGCDRKRSSAAVANALSPRPEHLWPTYIPSHAKSPAGVIEATH